MNNTEKLVAIFTPEFVNENANLSSIDAIYEKVVLIEPAISKREVEEFLIAVSELMHRNELSENDLDEVSGGIGLLAIAAGIVGVCAVFGATYAIGTAIGKTIYNLRH